MKELVDLSDDFSEKVLFKIHAVGKAMGMIKIY